MFMHILNQIRFHLYQYSFFSDDIYYNIVREKGHQQDALFDNSKFLSKIFFFTANTKVHVYLSSDCYFFSFRNASNIASIFDYCKRSTGLLSL